MSKLIDDVTLSDVFWFGADETRRCLKCQKEFVVRDSFGGGGCASEVDGPLRGAPSDHASPKSDKPFDAWLENPSCMQATPLEVYDALVAEGRGPAFEARAFVRSRRDMTDRPQGLVGPELKSMHDRLLWGMLQSRLQFFTENSVHKKPRTVSVQGTVESIAQEYMEIQERQMGLSERDFVQEMSEKSFIPFVVTKHAWTIDEINAFYSY